MDAIVLETEHDVDQALPGLYVVESGTAAYFPVMALIEAGLARFMGELYDEDTRVVTLEVFPTPETTALYGLGDNGEQRVMPISPEFFVTALKDYQDWQPQPSQMKIPQRDTKATGSCSTPFGRCLEARFGGPPKTPT